MLSAGNDHDSVHAVELLKKVEISGSNVLADRAYGAKTIRAYISEQGASYVIPPQSNVSDPWPVDWWLYKERHLVECFFQKLKWFRRIATRYDKLDASFLAFVYLASIAVLLIYTERREDLQSIKLTPMLLVSFYALLLQISPALSIALLP